MAQLELHQLRWAEIHLYKKMYEFIYINVKHTEIFLMKNVVRQKKINWLRKQSLESGSG